MKSLRLLVLAFFLGSLQAEIIRVDIDGVIDPVTAKFLARAVAEAEDRKAEFLLIRLSTPGGLGISMREMVEAILNAKVPVVCYVSPQGAHAASAGFFILLSADVAVMAPGTNTGAAAPIFPFGAENETLMEKIKNDFLANLRSIVEQRKRNYELAEKGVTESLSYSAQEALEGGLIDLIAASEEELFELLEAKEVVRLDGTKLTLQSQGKAISTIEMTPREKLLSSIADPNLAAILGVIGLAGLFFEYSNPGMIVPGVVGAIALILALLGFSGLPINVVGVMLLVLAIGLLIAEIKVQGFGMFGIGGGLAMLLGLIFLVDSPYPNLRIGWSTAFSLTLPFVLLVLFLLQLAWRVYRIPVAVGASALLGREVEVRHDTGPSGGQVFVEGELWKAVSEAAIRAGERATVKEVKGLTLVLDADDKSEPQGKM